MHTKVDIGSHLEISEPVNLFALAHKARKHIFLAGGIGITPMLAMLDFCKKAKASCELHYAVRSDEAGAFCRELADEADHGVHVYRSNRGERIPLAAILGNQPLGTHVYICGPQRMIDWALDVAKHEGWPEENIHWEPFSTQPPIHRVLTALPPKLVDYKSISRHHQATAGWLSQYDDDEPGPQGFLTK